MIIAVDTGATKTLVAGTDAAGKFHTRYRFPTPKDTGKYIDQLAQVILEDFDIKKVHAISIALPGPIINNKATYCPNLGWKDFDVITHLRRALGTKTKIFVENDANLAGLAEAHAIAQTPPDCLYVTLSTGIGTGIVRKGKIDPIFNQSEGGHMVLEFDGALHYWEDFASGRAVYETYGKYARDIHDKATWEAIADKISRGLIAIIPLIQPDMIIIGGSIGTYFDRYEKTLNKVLDERLAHYISRPKLKAAKHPEEAVIYGCKIYADQKLSK